MRPAARVGLRARYTSRMDTSSVDFGLPLVLVAGVTVVVCVVVARSAGLSTGRDSVTASLRAVLQLGVVALLLDRIVGSLAASLGFVAVMTVAATWTAARRITGHRSGWWTGVAIVLGALPVTALLVGTRVVPAEGIAIIPVAGILIGGAMSAAVLAGRRGFDELASRRGEVEAGLALGLDRREAILEVLRPAAVAALVPSLDQTRTVGLVTLPGTFVGLLLGGATPAEAGAVQTLVLVTVLTAATVAVAVLLELISRGVIVRSA